MSSNITKIDYGQQNWNEPINKNFENLDADSGWVSIPLLAPFTGDVYVRKLAHSVEIKGFVKSDEDLAMTYGTPIAKIPDGLSGTVDHYFVAFADGNGRYARMRWIPTGELSLYDVTPSGNIIIRFSKTITI